jgi:hypothetical protein
MADQIRATPRSPILGLFSDLVNLPLQYMSSPERTQQMQGTAQFLYGTGIPKTLERASYGESLFSGAGGLGGTTRMRPETAEAVMTVAPFAPVAGRVAGRTGQAFGRMAGEEINAAMTGQPTRSLLGEITPKPQQIFIGENARTWSQANANKFLDMESQGMSPIEIWKKTGTFRTPDGALKQEIPDNLARLRADFNASIANKANNYKSGIEGEIGGMLEYSELFKAYPDLLKNLRYTVNKQPDWLPESAAGAQYSKTFGGKEKISTSTKTEEDALSKLMHELQHAVQTRENWQSGGLESQFKDTPQMSAFDQYRALAGEVEARAVQARRTMTPQQRQETFPLSNYDLPIESVRYGDPFGNTTR